MRERYLHTWGGWRGGDRGSSETADGAADVGQGREVEGWAGRGEPRMGGSIGGTGYRSQGLGACLGGQGR